MSALISGKDDIEYRNEKPQLKLVFFIVLSVFGLRVAGNLTFCDITILITFCIILLKGYKFSVSELIVPLIFIFSSSVGIIFVSSGDLVEYMKDLLQISFYLISAAALSRYVLNNFNLKSIFDSIILAGVIVSLLGVLQYFVIYFLNVNIFTFISSMGGRDQWVDNYIRVSSITQHINHLPLVLFPPLAIALYRRKYKYAFLIMLGIFASGSRSGIAASLALIYISFFINRNIFTLILSSVVAFSGFTYFIYGTDFFEKRLAFVASGTVDGSTQYRLDLWKRAWDLVLNYPLFGVGMGQESWMLKVDNLESSIMQILVNFGFFGLFLFLISIALVFIKALRGYSLLGISMLLLYMQLIFQPFLFVSVVGPCVMTYSFFIYNLTKMRKIHEFTK